MLKRVFLISFLFTVFVWKAESQAFIKTSDLFKRTEEPAGKLTIEQNPEIDSIMSRYILANRQMAEENGNGNVGMPGYRIQIYSSSNRNAREESGKTRAEFISKFPDIVSYILYSEPGYFKVRAGDYRTKTEAVKPLQKISRVFPDAYLVPDYINFPDQNIK